MDHHDLHQLQGMQYGQEAMKWYGWGSPIGLGLGLGLILMSVGGFLWLLNAAGVM